MIPQISVIIPVYNGEKYLQETVESILRQTFQSFELVIVDDASSDGSVKVLNEFARKDPRIKVFLNDANKGISITTNFGIEHAQGEYIALTDQDDISIPIRFEKQVGFLESHPEIDVLGTQIINIDSSGEIIRTKSNFPTTPGAIRWSLMFGCMLANPTVIFRRKVFHDFGFRFGNFKAAQDYDLFTRLAIVFRLANLPQSLVYHRSHPNNYSKIKSELQQQETYDIVRSSVLDLIGENLSDDIISGILYAKHLKKQKEILNVKTALQVSSVLCKLECETKKWELLDTDRVFIKENTASRLRRMWKDQKFHPMLLPYVLYSLVLDPEVIKRKITKPHG